MTKRQVDKEQKILLVQLRTLDAAIEAWRAEQPEQPGRKSLLPSSIELVSYLSHRLRMSRLALKAAIKHVRNHNTKFRHSTPESLIQLWEKML